MKTTVRIILALILFLFTFETIDKPPKPVDEEEVEIDIEVEEKTKKFTTEDIPIYRVRIPGDSYYVQILNRAKSPFMSNTRSTNAHESVHSINNELRNQKAREIGYKYKVNAFYMLGNQVFYAKEPNMSKAKVAEFLPTSLRGYRFKTYIAGQTEWNDMPLYLIDEWSAYIAGGRVCNDDLKMGRYKEGNTDGVGGTIEFSIYCTALCMAIEQYDPTYFRNNPEFLPFVSRMLELSHAVYFEGQNFSELNWFAEQKELLNALRSSNDAKKMREFMREKLSGIWLDKG